MHVKDNSAKCFNEIRYTVRYFKTMKKVEDTIYSGTIVIMKTHVVSPPPRVVYIPGSVMGGLVVAAFAKTQRTQELFKIAH